MMKTLILNGSPKANGDTAALIDEMSKHLQGEVSVVSSVFNNINPCVDCRYCREHSGCAIDDDMQEIYKFIKDCDNIIIASPIWFSELSGPLLNIGSRFQTYFAANYFRNEPPNVNKLKNGVLILVGAQSDTEKKAVSTAYTLFRLMNALPCIASVFSLDTNNVPAIDDLAAMNKIRNTAVLLNKLHQEKT